MPPSMIRFAEPDALRPAGSLEAQWLVDATARASARLLHAGAWLTGGRACPTAAEVEERLAGLPDSRMRRRLAEELRKPRNVLRACANWRLAATCTAAAVAALALVVGLRPLLLLLLGGGAVGLAMLAS
jgi:hypothetical protein